LFHADGRTERQDGQTTAENTSTSTFIRKPEAATAVLRAPDDGHCKARNMLSSVCTTKQYILRLIVAASWVFYLRDRQTYRRADKTKPIVAFRNFANAPINL